MGWEVELLKELGLSEADREKIDSGNARNCSDYQVVDVLIYVLII